MEKKLKIGFPKEMFANKTTKELQETLNKYIEAGLLPPSTTLDDIGPYEPPKHPSVRPIVYMTPEMRECIFKHIEEGNIGGLWLILKILIKDVDAETMKQIQQLVENKENN